MVEGATDSRFTVVVIRLTTAVFLPLSFFLRRLQGYRKLFFVCISTTNEMKSILSNYGTLCILFLWPASMADCSRYRMRCTRPLAIMSARA